MNDDVISRVPSNLLFRHRFACLQTQEKWSASAVTLKAKHKIPHFGQFEDQPAFADVRAAWSPDGLFFDVSVSGKSQSIWCRPTQILESDGVMIWVDTRNTQSIHRASRFCHWFVFMPTGQGEQKAGAMASMLKINRAKEDSKTFQAFQPRLKSSITADGYRLQFHIERAALNGWNSDEYRQLGFNYLVNDRELGIQTLATDNQFPIASDPSLWHTMILQ
jgi:hypothetical protein